jgi:CRISPR/Cas system CSM-associated protein Csm3 (group 7 of RAMP superfamily)
MNQTPQDKYNYNRRYIARLVVEADTPLAVGSGQSDILTDSPVSLDANDLPYIPGTALTGVLRHAFAKEPSDSEKEIFGFQEENQSKNGKGSRLILSHASVLDDKQVAVEGLDPTKSSDYLKNLSNLCIREHCKINHRGVSDQEAHGKFDNQVVPKGVRFVFEMELIATEQDEKNWQKLLEILQNPTFRLGGGTRKGYGKLKVITEKSKVKTFNLGHPQDLKAYLEKTASLNSILDGTPLNKCAKTTDENYVEYCLDLLPENSWFFGSGFGDDEADMTPVYEKVVEWDNNKPSFTKCKKILIPATSLKGAISHRVAFHYNKLKGNFADGKNQKELESLVGENNPAVRALFGCAKNSKEAKGQIGNVIFSDVFLEDKNKTKIFNHVSLDRFTGGARNSFLFDEKVLTQKESLRFEILVLREALSLDKIKEAFEATLKDICNGMLPLGGSVMRGHGVFQGTCETEGETL